MFFKKYNVLIFRDREGGYRNVRMRSGFILILLALILGLIALNLYLWGFYKKSAALERELQESNRVLQEQNSQMLGLASRVENLGQTVQRIKKFDSQLRVLLNIDSDSAETQHERADAPPSFDASRPQVLIQHRELFGRHVLSLLNLLSGESALEEVSQQELILFLRENKDSILAMPSIWPANGRVTSGFGYRSSPLTGRRSLHQGLDLANKIGTPVWATARGVVTHAGWDKAYGKAISIDHGNNIVTKFAHLNTISVQVGQTVQRGEVIGAMGNTGRSTGPHLHYEVKVGGAPVNPMRYILN